MNGGVQVNNRTIVPRSNSKSQLTSSSSGDSSPSSIPSQISHNGFFTPAMAAMDDYSLSPFQQNSRECPPGDKEQRQSSEETVIKPPENNKMKFSHDARKKFKEDNSAPQNIDSSGESSQKIHLVTSIALEPIPGKPPKVNISEKLFLPFKKEPFPLRLLLASLKIFSLVGMISCIFLYAFLGNLLFIPFAVIFFVYTVFVFSIHKIPFLGSKFLSLKDKNLEQMAEDFFENRYLEYTVIGEDKKKEHFYVDLMPMIKSSTWNYSEINSPEGKLPEVKDCYTQVQMEVNLFLKELEKSGQKIIIEKNPTKEKWSSDSAKMQDLRNSWAFTIPRISKGEKTISNTYHNLRYLHLINNKEEKKEIDLFEVVEKCLFREEPEFENIRNKFFRKQDVLVKSPYTYANTLNLFKDLKDLILDTHKEFQIPDTNKESQSKTHFSNPFTFFIGDEKDPSPSDKRIYHERRLGFIKCVKNLETQENPVDKKFNHENVDSSTEFKNTLYSVVHGHVKLIPENIVNLVNENSEIILENERKDAIKKKASVLKNELNALEKKIKSGIKAYENFFDCIEPISTLSFDKDNEKDKQLHKFLIEDFLSFIKRSSKKDHLSMETTTKKLMKFKVKIEERDKNEFKALVFKYWPLFLSSQMNEFGIEEIKLPEVKNINDISKVLFMIYDHVKNLISELDKKINQKEGQKFLQDIGLKSLYENYQNVLGKKDVSSEYVEKLNSFKEKMKSNEIKMKPIEKNAQIYKIVSALQTELTQIVTFDSNNSLAYEFKNLSNSDDNPTFDHIDKIKELLRSYHELIDDTPFFRRIAEENRQSMRFFGGLDAKFLFSIEKKILIDELRDSTNSAKTDNDIGRVTTIQKMGVALEKLNDIQLLFNKVSMDETIIYREKNKVLSYYLNNEEKIIVNKAQEILEELKKKSNEIGLTV